ncbi:MAG: disulfide oxidoreductase [candidate division Zixibacteria bacterium HGW-Zixibacteria-1]|nr:MAG: disulfide oxidoreductase [candidate division Zixibacteria bacterium HGW-Zixibacteria-1]
MDITKDTSIGDIIANIPGAASVIKKYFHGGCYGCPSMKMETLEMGAELHGHDVNKIIAELKQLA